MKTIEALTIAMLKSVKQFGEDNPLTPPIEKATLHYGEVDTILTKLETYGGSQDLSNGTLHGTTAEKLSAALALRKVMGRLAKIAKVLDKTLYPTVAAEMRLKGAYTYPALLERGRAFVSALAGKAPVFIEYGAPATIAADLTAALNALDAAVNHKESALSTRVGSTAGLQAFTRAGVRAMRKLDAILSGVYEDDPVLLAAWNTAKHIDAAPVAGSEESEVPPAGGGDGSGSGSGGSSSLAANNAPPLPVA